METKTTAKRADAEPAGWGRRVMTASHIYAPLVMCRFVLARRCPDCGRRTRMLGFGYGDWHGANVTCLRCGREWQDSEWIPLPFSRSARENNIQAAKERWRKMSAQKLL